MIEVEKRDGSIVTFDSSKIFSAISKAFDSLHMEKDDAIINLLVLRATADFQTKIKENHNYSWNSTIITDTDYFFRNSIYLYSFYWQCFKNQSNRDRYDCIEHQLWRLSDRITSFGY